MLRQNHIDGRALRQLSREDLFELAPRRPPSRHLACADLHSSKASMGATLCPEPCANPNHQSLGQWQWLHLRFSGHIARTTVRGTRHSHAQSNDDFMTSQYSTCTTIQLYVRLHLRGDVYIYYRTAYVYISSMKASHVDQSLIYLKM